MLSDWHVLESQMCSRTKGALRGSLLFPLCKVDDAEVHFLVLHYLALGPCKAAAEVLEAEASSHGLLPGRYDIMGMLPLLWLPAEVSEQPMPCTSLLSCPPYCKIARRLRWLSPRFLLPAGSS
jgi:hypothetical protein